MDSVFAEVLSGYVCIFLTFLPILVDDPYSDIRFSIFVIRHSFCYNKT